MNEHLLTNPIQDYPGYVLLQVLCNVDELFEREELSAAPDPGWPDCFNSGVFVFRPSLETHSCLLEHAKMCGSFDGEDEVDTEGVEEKKRIRSRMRRIYYSHRIYN